MATGQAASCDADELFRVFTLPVADVEKHYLILDLRDLKVYKKGHIVWSFCVRLSSNGKVLAEYSKAEYKLKWSTDVWVGRQVYVYGNPGLSRAHPAITFLVSSGSDVHYYKEGYEALSRAYPCLVTTSVRGSPKHYPSQILPGFLYLGDWNHAVSTDRLDELNVKAIVTIHNNPENLPKQRSLKGIQWLSWELPDIDTADIAACFSKTFDFLEEARAKNHAVLVHCGAGVSRSATLVCMYLMRRFMWSAQKAKDHCIQRRSGVMPNDGFWRTLCALEPALGITSRSDPTATSGFHGADAPPPAPATLTDQAVGGKVPVTHLTVTEYKRTREEQQGEGAEPPAKRHQTGSRTHTLTVEVRKPEGVVGGLVIGPIGPHQRVIFGRLPSCDVPLEHASISRQHATISVDAGGTLLLTDLQSGHGTKLDDVWLRPNAPKELRKGAVFSFGASSRQYAVVDVEKGTSG